MRRPHIVLQTLSGCCTILILSAACAAAGDHKKGASAMTVSNGKQVTLAYTLKLEDQSVVDTNVGGEPLKVTQGSHQLIRGVEKQLEGMAVGEKKAEVLNSASKIADKSFLDVTELLSSSPDLTGLKSELKSTSTKSLGWPAWSRVS